MTTPLSFDDIKPKVEQKDSNSLSFDDLVDTHIVSPAEERRQRANPQQLDNYKRTAEAILDPKAIYEDIKGLVKFPFEMIDAASKTVTNGLNFITGEEDFKSPEFWKHLAETKGGIVQSTPEQQAFARKMYHEALADKVAKDQEAEGSPTLSSLTVGQIPAVFHVGQTIVNAETPKERGDAIRHALELLAFKAAEGKRIPEEVKGETTPVIKEVVKPAAVAQNNVVNEIARSLPIEGEQAAIKNRLMTEGRENLVESIAKAHNDVHPAGTTIIPSLDSPGEAIALAKKSNPLLRTALFKKENGGYDLAIFGDKSPLAEGDNLKEFEKNGYFPLEEVSKQGGRFIYRQTLDNGALKLSKVSDPSSSIYVSPYDVRRPPFSERAFPFVETPQAPDIIRARVGTTRLLSREEVISDKFNKFVKDTYGDQEIPWDRKVAAFTKAIGLPAEEAPGLKNFLEYRVAKELRETYLSDDERSLFNSVADRVKEETGQFPSAFQVAAKILEGGHTLPLDLEAATNGHRLELSVNGDYILKDSNNRILMRAKTSDAVREYLSKVGQTGGDDLVKDTSIPVNAIGGGAMPPSGIEPPAGSSMDGLSTPYKVHEPGFFGRLVDRFRASFDMATTRMAHFEAADNYFKTKIASWLRGLDMKKSAVANELAPWAKRLDEISHSIKDLSVQQWHDITRYMNTMSADEIPGKLFRNRSLTADEIKYGEDIAKLGDIDVHKAIKFSRLSKAIKEDMMEGVSKEDMADKVKASKIHQDIASEIAKLGLAMGMDDPHMAAAGIFEALRYKDIDNASIYAVSRYADALINKTPTMEEFAALNKMNGAQLKAAKLIEQFYEDARNKHANIPDHRLLNGYTFHVRAQGDAPSVNAAFLFQKGFGRSLEEQFIAELARTGEIDVYEMNPISAAFRYINNAVKNKEFNPAFNVAVEQLFGNKSKNIIGELNKVSDDSREAMADHVKRYLSDLRGIRPAAVRLTSDVFSTLADNLRVNPGPTLMNRITNSLIDVVGSALLAGRSQIALRHLAWFQSAYGSRFGFSTAMRGLVLASDPAEIAALKKQGIMAPITTTSLAGPTEESAARLAGTQEALAAFKRTGTKLSGLSYIYEHTYAAAYLGYREKVLDALNSVLLGKSTKQAAYSKIFINSFPVSAVREFDALVSGNRVNDAATMIAKEAARKTVFDYTNANYPRGWNTNVGKFATMFGIFPTYMTEFVSDMLTKGTIGERAAFITRFAASQGAIYAAGRMSGIDLTGATISHGLLYSGSPQLQLVQTLTTALKGRGEEKRLAQYRLHKLIPSLDDPRSMFVPGSYAIGDWVSAYKDFNNPNRTILQAAGRALGFPVIKEKSWLDDWIPTIR